VEIGEKQVMPEMEVSTMRAKTCVQVSVFDYQRIPLPNAQVTLKSLEQGYDQVIRLEYDARRRAYQAADVRPGQYVVRAEAKGFEPQEREVQVDPAGIKDTFILGKEGMPFYYRGKARVPFEPPEDLLGVSVRPGLSDRQEEELLAFASEVKLEPVKVGEPVREDNVRVFRFPRDTSEQNKREIQRHLARHPLVRLVGPVVHIDKDRVTFSTNQLVAKFRAHVTREEIPVIADHHNLEIIRTIPYAGNTYLLHTGREADYDLFAICDALVKSDLVEYAEPNLVITAADAQINPTDFLYSQQWHIPLIHLPEAWDVLQNENAPGVVQGDPGDLTFGSENVIVAIFDRGIQSQTVGGVTSAAHADFDGTVTSGDDKVYEFCDFANMVSNNDTPPNDHGMGCAGVATALANNASVVAGEEEGVVGAAPNCQVMGLIRPAGLGELRYSDAYIWMAGFYPGWVADGTDYPVGTVFPVPPNPGADIISNSFYWDPWPISGLMSDTIDFLTTYGRSGKGVLLFICAGNMNRDFSLDQALAVHPKTMAVAASSLDDDGVTEIRAAYSDFGDGIDFCAPSHDEYVGGGALHNPPANYGVISCDLPGGGNLAGHTGGPLDYRNNFGGTSSATPLVAGVAALVLSLDPELTWVEVRQILHDTAQKIDPNNTDPDGRWQDVDGRVATDPGYLGPHYSEWYGYGRIDAEAAIIAARDYAHDRDIVIRENLADVGSVPSAGVFYDSPDIWVRNRAPAVDGAAALPASYHHAPPHLGPISEQDNWIYVRFKNVGTAPSYDFYVRVYLTHFAGTEFVYPDNYIPTNRPGDPVPTPLEPGTYLIGEVHCPSLDGENSDILNMRWPEELVPPQTVVVSGVPVTWHPCLLAEVSPHDSPVALPLLEALIHVWDSNDLAQKNISVIYSDADAFAMAGVLGNLANQSPYLELLVDRRKVPPQVELFVELLDPRAKEWLRTFVQEHKPELPSARSRLTFLEETRVAIDYPRYPGSSQMVLTLPAQTKLEVTEPDKCPDDTRYNFTLGSYKGREVAWLAPREQTCIPVFTGGDKLVPMILGAVVRKEVQPGDYEIGLTQLDPNGKPSGGLAVQLKIGG
jgi:subtilisin family serine protease